MSRRIIPWLCAAAALALAVGAIRRERQVRHALEHSAAQQRGEQAQQQRQQQEVRDALRLEQARRALLMARHEQPSILAVRLAVQSLPPPGTAQSAVEPEVSAALIRVASRFGYPSFPAWESAQPEPSPLFRAARWNYSTAPPVAFSADGSYFAAASPDGSVRLFDVQRGRLLHQIQAHPGELATVDFSPDSRRLLTAGREPAVRGWDVQSGRPLFELTPDKHRSEVARFLPDGTHVVSHSLWKTALMDAQSGAQLRVFAGRIDPAMTRITTRDGSKLLTLSPDRLAQLWDLASGALVRSIRAPGEFLERAELFPDDGRLLTVSHTGQVGVFSLATGALLYTFPTRSSSRWVVRLSPSGSFIAASDTETDVVLRSADSGKHSCSVPTPAGGRQAHALGFSPSSRRFATASEDGTVRIFQTQGCQLVGTIQWARSRMHFVAFTPDEQRLLVAKEDGAAQLFELSPVEPTSFPATSGYPMQALLAPDGSTLLTLGSGKPVQSWDGRSGALRATWSIARSQGLFFPDGRQLLTLSQDRAVDVLDSASGALRLHLRPAVGTGGVTAMDLSSDGQRVLLADSRGPIELFDVASGKRLLSLPIDPRSDEVVFRPDGKAFLAEVQLKGVQLFDSETGQPLLTFESGDAELRSARFAPDGSRVLLRGVQRRAPQLWDTRTGKQIATLKTQGEPTKSLALSSDGLRAAVGTLDGKVFIFDGERGTPQSHAQLQAHPVDELAFSEDGRRLAAVQLSAGASVLDVASGQLVAEFSQDHSLSSHVRFFDHSERLLVWDELGSVRAHSLQLDSYVRRACQLLSGHPGEYAKVLERCRPYAGSGAIQ